MDVFESFKHFLKNYCQIYLLVLDWRMDARGSFRADSTNVTEIPRRHAGSVNIFPASFQT